MQSCYQHLNHLKKYSKIILELFIFPFQWKISYLFLCWGIDLLQASLDSLDSSCGIYGCSLRGNYSFPLDFLWDRKKDWDDALANHYLTDASKSSFPGRVLCPREVLVVLCICHSLNKNSLSICCVSSIALS